MVDSESAKDDHRARSAIVRQLVQRCAQVDASSTWVATAPPKRIIQFWNDGERLPDDVRECMQSWSALEREGFEVLRFDALLARSFIAERLGSRYEAAYDRCYHPAMQADYFRLCYTLVEGGLYVDSDDVYSGSDIEFLFSDGRLKIQPLCYDISTDAMVPLDVFARPGAHSPNWIFYFNNNPLIAGPRHPIVRLALTSATRSLECHPPDDLPEIQSTTGPGNLTESVRQSIADRTCDADTALVVLRDWERIATSRWPLSYRQDKRNWRLSNRRSYGH